MESNIMQNAINYLAQTLNLQPSELIGFYAAQGQAKVYMLLVCVAMAIICAWVQFLIIRTDANRREPEIEVLGLVCFVVMIGAIIAILALVYDVFLWLSDPQAYAMQKILRDINLWRK